MLMAVIAIYHQHNGFPYSILRNKPLSFPSLRRGEAIMVQVTNSAGARHVASHFLHTAPPPASPCFLLPRLVREQNPENRYEIQPQDKKKQKNCDLEDE